MRVLNILYKIKVRLDSLNECLHCPGQYLILFHIHSHCSFVYALLLVQVCISWFLVVKDFALFFCGWKIKNENEPRFIQDLMLTMLLKTFIIIILRMQNQVEMRR
jgi:hypothetical protein